MQGDYYGAIKTLTYDQLKDLAVKLKRIASFIPGFDKFDARCNGFKCAYPTPNGMTCSSAGIAQKKKEFCGVSLFMHLRAPETFPEIIMTS